MLLRVTASGFFIRSITSVELIGVTNNRDESQTVFDLKLSDAQLTSFVNTPGAGGIDTSLAFDFHNAKLTDQGRHD